MEWERGKNLPSIIPSLDTTAYNSLGVEARPKAGSQLSLVYDKDSGIWGVSQAL